MRFLAVDGGREIALCLRWRRGDQRRIRVAASACRRIKGDVLKTFAGGGCRQTLGDLHFSGEKALVCYIARILELFGERVERRVHEVFLCHPRCRACIETGLIGDQRDAAAAAGALDDEVASLDVRRCRGIMGKEHLRMAEIFVDGDLSLVPLEDQSCSLRITAAGQFADMTAGKLSRHIRPSFFVLPNAAILQPEIGCSVAVDEALQMGRLPIDCGIYAACRIFCHDMTVERYRTHAAVVVSDVDIDASVVLRIQRRRILRGSVCRCVEVAQCHRAVECLHGFADLRAADLDLCRTRYRRRASQRPNAPSRVQRSRRNRVVHEELQRLCLDVKVLPIGCDGSSLLDAFPLAAAFDRQHTICGINTNIRIRLDGAHVYIRAVSVCDRRILGKAIRTVRLPHIGVDVLLIRGRAEEAFRELRRRLSLCLRRIDIAALPRRRVKRDVLDALRCGRRRKTLGDGRFAREVALAARIRRVAELFREGVERRADEIFVCRFLRLRIEADVVRQHRDLAVCRRFLDGGRAAVDRRRRRRVVAVTHGRIAAELFDFEVARLAESLFYDGRAFSLPGGAGDARLIEAVAQSEEAVRARHVDEAAAAAEVFHTADGGDVLPALLLRRDSIVPRRAVTERQLHIVFDVEAGPLRIGA